LLVAPVFRGKDEPLIKKVWYGVGKAVESQMPRAWNERIIKTINEKIIPKLTPEQLAWVAKNHKVIEGTATGLSVGIWTGELIVLEVVAYKAIQIGYKKYQRMMEPGRIKKNKALLAAKRQIDFTNRSYDTIVASEAVHRIADNLPGRLPEISVVVQKKPWKPKSKLAGKILTALEPFGVHLTVTKTITERKTPWLDESTRWFHKLAKVYQEKYGNSVEAGLLVATVRVMLERVSLFAKSGHERKRMQLIARLASSKSEDRQMKALVMLESDFDSAFYEAAGRYNNWYGDTAPRAFVQQLRAKQLFDNWRGIGLRGLHQIIATVSKDSDALLRFTQNGSQLPVPHDFSPLFENPRIPTLEMILQEKQKHHRELLPPEDMDSETYHRGSFVHPESARAEFESRGLIQELKSQDGQRVADVDALGESIPLPQTSGFKKSRRERKQHNRAVQNLPRIASAKVRRNN
jgi:hypothetical protein